MTKWITETECRARVANAKRGERKKRQEAERDSVVLRRERKQYKLEAARRGKSAEEWKAKAMDLEEKLAREKAKWSTHKEGVPEWEMGDAPADPGAAGAHAREVLDSILRNKDATREASGQAAEKFEHILRRFEAQANRRTGGSPPPLFYGARGRGS